MMIPWHGNSLSQGDGLSLCYPSPLSSPFLCLAFLSPSLRATRRLLRTSLILVGTSARAKTTLRGVEFDSDGTLTLPEIDLQAMYREVFRPEAYAVTKQTGGGILTSYAMALSRCNFTE